MSMILYYWMSKGEHSVCYWVDLSIPAAWGDFYFCCLRCRLSSGHSLFPEPGGMSLAGVIKNCVTGDGHNGSLERMRQCTRAASKSLKTDRCSLLLDWFQTKHSCWFSASPWTALVRTVGVASPSGMQKTMKKKIKFLWKKNNLLSSRRVLGHSLFCFHPVGKNLVCF